MAYQSVFGNQNTPQKSSTPSSGGYQSVFGNNSSWINNTPSATSKPQAPPSNPVQEITTGAAKVAKTFETGFNDITQNVGNIFSSIGTVVNQYRQDIANSTPITKQIGDVFNNLGTQNAKGKVIGLDPASGQEVKYTGNTVQDLVSALSTNVFPALLPGAGMLPETAGKGISIAKVIKNAALNSAIQIAGGASPSDVIKNAPFAFLGAGKELESGRPITFTANEAKNEVVSTDLAGTPLGKEILKNSFEADKNGNSIQITHDPNSNLKTSLGFPVKVEQVSGSEKSAFTIEQKGIEKSFSDQINSNLDQTIADYQKQFGNVLNTDNAKELSKEYSASNESRAALSAIVHEPASQLIKDMYTKELAKPDSKGYNAVLFTAGATGAGKTSALENLPGLIEAKKQAQIVYDTTGANYKSFADKVDQALTAGKNVAITYVHRSPEEALVNGSLPRAEKIGRTVPLSEHIDTHINAPQSIIKIAEKYKDDPRVHIEVVDNTKGKGQATLANLDILKDLNYNKDELTKQLSSKLDEQYLNNKISKETYQGTKGNSIQAVGTSNSPSNGGVSEQVGKQLQDLKLQSTPDDKVLNPIIDDIIKQNGQENGTQTENNIKENTSNQSGENTQPQADKASSNPNESTNQNSSERASGVTGQGSQDTNTNSRVGVNGGGEPTNSGRDDVVTKSVSDSTGNGQGLKVSKIAKEIDAKAVENKLTEGYSKLAGFSPVTIKDQAARATDLVQNHYEDAKAVINGDKPLPEGLKGISLITAMEEHLAKNPDGQALMDLAKSKLITGTSEAAQELRLAAERDPYAPLSVMKRLENDNRAVIEKQAGESVNHVITKDVAKGAKEITKAVSKGDSTSKGKLADFIKGIQCGV